MTITALNLAKAFGGLPVDVTPSTISRQIIKKVCVSASKIIKRLSKIEDGGQDYGREEAIEKFQDPELLSADQNFCGSVLFDPQRYLGNRFYQAPSPLSFTIEPVASSVIKETFNLLIRVECSSKISGVQTYH